MNEHIKELAEQAGICGGQQITIDSLERFAELIRADEREACAKLCEENMRLTTGLHHAAAIRQRGEK